MTQEIDFLALQDLIEIGNSLTPDFRIRDIGLLDSASKRPKTTVFGDDAYPTFPEKVAALIHSLARNHALIDGNKRIACAAGRIFCLMNGFDLVMTVDEAEAMILSVDIGELDAPELSHLLTPAIS